MTKKERALLAVEALKKEYPGAVCSLEYQDPLQLLIATRLSAQCTDARVNLVTPALFARFPTLEAFCAGSEEEIAELIRSCGLYKTKARDIFAMCHVLRDSYNGVIPDTVDELTKLPGVGRKTANLVVGDIYKKPAVVTDTHCIRITGRLGLTESNVPLKVEKDLRAVLPPEESNDFCHRTVLHGRAVCTARNPKCALCCMNSFCKNPVNPIEYNLALYEDKTFPLPDNFFDDYEGRPAAAAQEMSIVKDMDMIYDLKMLRPNEKSRLRSLYERFLGRMDEGQRAAWDKFYAPIIDDFYKQNLTGKELANWKFQRYMRDYMKTVKSLDDNVGRVLDYLKEKGLLDNTLVVYTSDQGFYMGEHGWFDKRFMYEESMRTPLIMRLPKGFDRRGDITEMVQNIDYAPTFLELAGAEIPADIHGVSLLPLLKGEHPKDWRKSLYYHFYEYPAEHMVKRHYGVRTERYKLIHFYNDINWWELYDMQADPSEMHNLYGEAEYEPVVKELKDELLKLQEQYNDPVRFSPERDKE